MEGIAGKSIQIAPSDCAAVSVPLAVWKRVRRGGWDTAGLPQHVRARQRGVSAQLDFGDGREPSQREVGRGRAGCEKRGLGQVHLRRDRLHPPLVGGLVEDAHRGRVAAERLAGERVDLEEGGQLLDDDEDVAGADGVALAHSDFAAPCPRSRR